MSYQRYLKLLLSILGGLFLLNVISFLFFLNNPQKYYFRPWEYFPEVAYRFTEYEALWDRIETSDQTRNNLFYYQDPHHTYVSVDSDGYRKNYIESEKYKILVSGDSAVFGSGLSDNETLPWKLAEKMDVPVFNGGRSSLFNTLLRPDLSDVEIIIDLRTEREIKGNVFNSYGYRDGDEYTPQMKNDLKLTELPGVVSEKRYLFTSIAFRTFLRLLNDIRVLAAGGQKEYLFHSHTLTERDMENAVVSIIDRRNKVMEKGRDFIFVAIPSKQTLYDTNVDEYTRHYLSKLDMRLEEHGVETISLVDTFYKSKSRGLYHNYDSHWNSMGTEIASNVIAEYLAGRDAH